MRGVVHLGGPLPSAEAVAVALRQVLKHYTSSSSSSSCRRRSSSSSSSSSSILPSLDYYYYYYYYYYSYRSSSSQQQQQQQQEEEWKHKEPPSFYLKNISYYDDYTSCHRHHHGRVPPARAGILGLPPHCFIPSSFYPPPPPHYYNQHPRNFFTRPKEIKNIPLQDAHSQRAVTTALWCNFLVFSLKFGVWLSTSSHVMLAEVVHSVADFANQALLAYGLSSSRRAPDALHPYGYSKERFVWSLISAVGIFCLGSGATIVHGVQHLWTSHPPENIQYAALVIGGSFLIEGASLVVAIDAVKKGAASEGMKLRDYIWRGHDPTAVAVMTEDGAAVTGLLIAGASLVAVNATGNAIYDPIGSIIIGNLLGMVAVFLIQRNRHALIGRAMDQHDMERVLNFLKNDPVTPLSASHHNLVTPILVTNGALVQVVDALYDCKSEVIGPGFFRFKAEIDFNGVVLVQNYLSRTGREEWARQFREAAEKKDDAALLKIMSNYGEEVVTALGSEVDRLEKEIQEIVPGIRHVDIEAHNPIVPTPP